MELTSKVGDTKKKCVSDLEKRIMKITQSEYQKEKRLNYNSLRDISDNIKPININIIGNSKGEEG